MISAAHEQGFLQANPHYVRELGRSFADMHAGGVLTCRVNAGPLGDWDASRALSRRLSRLLLLSHIAGALRWAQGQRRLLCAL